MKIEVYSLNKVLKVAERRPGCNLLSIRDPYSGHADTDEKIACLDRRIARNEINAKVVYFDDIDPYRFYHGMEHPWIKAKFEDGTRQPMFFDASIAKDIVEWAIKVWEADHNATIVVHCWAGRSRSQAIAHWLNVYLNLVLDRNLEDYFANNAVNVHEKIHYNCEVLRVLDATYGSFKPGF